MVFIPLPSSFLHFLRFFFSLPLLGKNPQHSKLPIYFYNRDDPYYQFTNFYECIIDLDSRKWRTTEHYFQAQKFVGTPYVELIRQMHRPREAFDLSRNPSVSRWQRSDWEKVKCDVMMKALIAKFTQHDDLKAILLGTGTRLLVEHTSNDHFWGDGGDGSGKNNLGKLLMKVRDMLTNLQGFTSGSPACSAGIRVSGGDDRGHDDMALHSILPTRDPIDNIGPRQCNGCMYSSSQDQYLPSPFSVEEDAGGEQMEEGLDQVEDKLVEQTEEGMEDEVEQMELQNESGDKETSTNMLELEVEKVAKAKEVKKEEEVEKEKEEVNNGEKVTDVEKNGAKMNEVEKGEMKEEEKGEINKEEKWEMKEKEKLKIKEDEKGEMKDEEIGEMKKEEIGRMKKEEIGEMKKEEIGEMKKEERVDEDIEKEKEEVEKEDYDGEIEEGKSGKDKRVDKDDKDEDVERKIKDTFIPANPLEDDKSSR